MRRILVVTVVTGLVVAGRAGAAKPAPLDLIPADAAAGVAVRDLNGLKKKGDRLVADADLKASLRPSQLFDWLYQFLGINAGLDGDAAGAVVIANPQQAGGNLQQNIENLIVVAVPFRDRDRMAANFGIAAGALKPNTVVKGQGMNFGRFFYARGNHVFLGNNERAVTAVARAKPLGEALTAVQRRPLDEADLVLHFGATALGDDWKQLVKEIETELTRKAGAGDAAAVGEFAAALREVRFAQAALRVDGGLRISLQAIFPKDVSASARQFLTALQGRSGNADLAGLPKGPVLFAYASQGDGRRNVVPARLLLGSLLELLGPSPWLPSVRDRPTYLGVFAEVWKHLQGSRAAAYLNGDEARQGLLSVVAVLDTADPDRFLADLRQLARYADPAGLKLSPQASRREDVAEVERLIRDLGARQYRVRESATTRLRLIGEPTLPYLEKALKSPDLEVQRRARSVQDEIVAAAAERRKELLAHDPPWRLRPTFAFAPKAETRAGQAVDVLVVKLSGPDEAAAARLRGLFGPDWDKIRLAVQGKHVVALLGSDTSRLEATLRNVREGGDRARSDEGSRKFEVQFSQAALLALTKGEDLRQRRRADPSLTSIALAADTDRVQLTLWMPTAEVKAFVKGSGLNRMLGP